MLQKTEASSSSNHAVASGPAKVRKDLSFPIRTDEIVAFTYKVAFK